MIELIATITLIGSLIGIGVTFIRRIPDLEKLPETERGSLKESCRKIWLRIKNLRFFKPDFFENFLQKLLSKVKVLAIKTENKCSLRLQRIREKSVKREKAKNDTYWQKLKKSLKSKKKKKK